MRISDWSSDVCSSDLLWVLVSSVVVEDHMHALAYRNLALDRIEEADELLMAVALHDAVDQFAAAWDVVDQPLHHAGPEDAQIGSASGRERVCQSGYISVVGVTLHNKTHTHTKQ